MKIFTAAAVAILLSSGMAFAQDANTAGSNIVSIQIQATTSLVPKPIHFTLTSRGRAFARRPNSKPLGKN